MLIALVVKSYKQVFFLKDKRNWSIWREIYLQVITEGDLVDRYDRDT